MDKQNQSPIPTDDSAPKSSTGLDENLAGLLCYVATFVTGIIFLLLEKDSAFVKFHAMQSIVTFAGLGIISFVIKGIPFIGWLLSLCISFLILFLWIILMIKAYQKELYKLPIAGAIAENLVEKFDKKSKSS